MIQTVRRRAWWCSDFCDRDIPAYRCVTAIEACRRRADVSRASEQRYFRLRRREEAAKRVERVQEGLRLANSARQHRIRDPRAAAALWVHINYGSPRGSWRIQRYFSCDTLSSICHPGLISAEQQMGCPILPDTLGGTFDDDAGSR